MVVAHRARTALAPVAADITAVIRSLCPARPIAIDVPAQLAVSLDAHDLSEIVGNALDHAARHARSAVSVGRVRMGGI